jgi:putative transposase
MSKHLEPHGIVIGRKAVSRYYKIMAIEAVYPKMNLSKRNQAHKIYPYLLRGVEITKVNQVWSIMVPKNWTAKMKKGDIIS